MVLDGSWKHLLWALFYGKTDWKKIMTTGIPNRHCQTISQFQRSVTSRTLCEPSSSLFRTGWCWQSRAGVCSHDNHRVIPEVTAAINCLEAPVALSEEKTADSFGWSLRFAEHNNWKFLRWPLLPLWFLFLKSRKDVNYMREFRLNWCRRFVFFF